MADAEADGADVVQFFLGNPQSWKKPKPREDAEVLKASSMPLYVHAPYLINVASANNRVRIPSRKILQDTCDAASEINATAVIVHGGHADDNDMGGRLRALAQGAGVPRDRRCRVPGEHRGRRPCDGPALRHHRPAVGPHRRQGHRLLPGHLPCLGGGREARRRRRADQGITGRIDLVHCNDSRDAAGSGADRHANFGTGQIDPELLVAVVKAADAPVICETADEGRKDDIAFLREHMDYGAEARFDKRTITQSAVTPG